MFQSAIDPIRFNGAEKFLLPSGVVAGSNFVAQYITHGFVVLLWLNVYLFLLVQINLSPGFFPSLLVPYMFFFISLLQCLHFFLYFGTILNQWSILLTSVLNSPSDRLAISSSFSSAFGTLICYFIWAIFFFLG